MADEPIIHGRFSVAGPIDLKNDPRRIAMSNGDTFCGTDGLCTTVVEQVTCGPCWSVVNERLASLARRVVTRL